MVEARQEPQSSPSSLPSPQSSSPLQNRFLHNAYLNLAQIFGRSYDLGRQRFVLRHLPKPEGQVHLGGGERVEVEGNCSLMAVKLENLEENSPKMASGMQGIVLLVFSTTTME